MSLYAAKRGSCEDTHSTLASGPFSSAIQNTATGRTHTWHPGNVGWLSHTSASSGSPSSPSVPGKNP